MSSTAITIKPQKHRVHPCPHEKKIGLLNLLVTQNANLKTIVVTSADPDIIKSKLDNDNIVVLGDEEFIKSDLTCEFLISYDLPQKAVIYMARLAKATQKAAILLAEDEQNLLYPIETLLGRVIKQEAVSGFEYEVIVKPEESSRPAPKKMSKEQIKEVAKKQYEKSTQEDKPKSDSKPYDKKSYDKKPYDKKKSFDKPKDDKWAKKKKEGNKFLGKDENGKAIFSGKSGDRNHRYDGTPRDKYDAPKKVGKKISIKSLKKKPEEK